ncbi:MAG: NAD(P)H-hydrate dehydratase [bacterium]
MRLVTAEQMRELDRAAIEDVGIPGIVLMENASRGVFEVIASEASPLEGKRALVVCGRGNNGGDGFAVARHLLNAGAVPEIALAAAKGEVSGDARTNLEVCLRLKIGVTEVRGEKGLRKLSSGLRRADFVVDALLGTGVKGALKPVYEKMIARVNGFRGSVFAVDAPSGVSVDDGTVPTAAVRATHTVTFGMPKVGLFVYPGAGYAGKVYVVDIGIPVELLRGVRSEVELTPRALVRGCLAGRRADVHKGECGSVLVVGGSRGMSGAPCMAGMSALRVGAGLVYLAVPEGLHDLVERKFTEGVTLPQPEEDGVLSAGCVDGLVEKCGGVDAVVLGPGLGVTPGTRAVVEGVISEARAPVVVDADALNVIALRREVLRRARAPLILTPHPGEMARLMGTSAGAVQSARLESARGFAAKHNVTVVLKGAYSLTAAPRGRVYVNPTGNPGMATGGSGDVLSGVVGGLAAGGVPPVEAAAAGAYIHGLAGDVAVRSIHERALTATMMIRFIDRAMTMILHETRAKPGADNSKD